MNNYLTRTLLITAGLLFALGCTRTEQPESDEPSGSARFVVAMHQALTDADVAHVDVTVDAFDISPSTIPLVKSGKVWTGTMGRIRAGANRRFHAEAFNADGEKIYAGEVTSVAIAADETAVVNILAQQVNRPPPFENEAPIIDSLVVSSPSVTPGGTLSIQAAAHDPNPGDKLTIAWTATGGTFSATDKLKTSWTAPDSLGEVTLTLTVTDRHGSVAALSFIVRVEVVKEGNADVTVSFNSWPSVASVNATPTRVKVGEMLTVSAVADDPDGTTDTLRYSWAASCDGNWTDGNAANAKFTPTSLPASATCNNCELTVTVTDGRGGVNTGKLAICVGNNVTPSFPPLIASVYQSALTVTEGNVVRLRVNATDTRSRPLTFNWSTNVGMLGTPVVNDAGTIGEILWTAPACLRDGVTPRVSVRLATSETPELYTDHTFEFTWGSTGRICASGDLCFSDSDDYLARWTFDTSYEDSSIWNNDLIEASTDITFITPGVWGEAVMAPGQRVASRSTDDDELDFGTGDFTVALWVNEASNDDWLLSKAADYGLAGGWSLRSYYRQLYWYTQEGTFHTTGSFSSGWHHVAVVRSEGTLRFYVDGKLDSTHAFAAAITPTAAPLVIGSRGTGANPLNGMLDEVVILDRAATPLELNSLVSKSCR
ncbi:LamG domain-containing protein [Archangium sp.]|uniref:LamG domain-containing protein n=1 Tax=Archangium sp. TaxID=1872627 RepID=UPI002D700C20|nr:LamG-like jellyroll fold domain-containing protein [Archangium sp.]HYO55549.1 LamG-like jellyroll fold domain-containing protein [Archangium sp.]